MIALLISSFSLSFMVAVAILGLVIKKDEEPTWTSYLGEDNKTYWKIK